jgi:hypothetical protein
VRTDFPTGLRFYECHLERVCNSKLTTLSISLYDCFSLLSKFWILPVKPYTLFSFLFLDRKMWGKAFKTDKRKKSLLASKHILQPCVVVFVFVIFLASVPFLHIWQYKLKGGQNHSFVPFFKVCTCAMYKNAHVHT